MRFSNNQAQYNILAPAYPSQTMPINRQMLIHHHFCVRKIVEATVPDDDSRKNILGYYNSLPMLEQFCIDRLLKKKLWAVKRMNDCGRKIAADKHLSQICDFLDYVFKSSFRPMNELEQQIKKLIQEDGTCIIVESDPLRRRALGKFARFFGWVATTRCDIRADGGPMIRSVVISKRDE